MFGPSILQAVLFWGFFVYIALEVAFYFVFHLYMVPRANRRTEEKPYRDYGEERHRLMHRVLDRIEASSARQGISFRQAGEQFMYQWFERLSGEKSSTAGLEGKSSEPDQPTFLSSVPSVPSLLKTESSMSSSASADDCVSLSSGDNSFNETTPYKIVEDIGKDDMAEFLAWAFFAKCPDELDATERKELQLLFDIKEKRLGAIFEPGRLNKLRARRLSIDKVDVLHRPLLVYGLIWYLQVFMGVFLRFSGFQRVVSKKTGLTGWYRPASESSAEKLLPFVFFHGLAPGGLLFYLPMVLNGFINDGRASFLFENPNISCCLGFDALSEDETTQGVSEIVSRFYSETQGVAVCGHSFGSVPMTWLLHTPEFRHRIQQFVLLDPVTILLSDPDVMVNFLYSLDTNGARILAGSELFTVHYLRRHFAWYNSELWMDDLPDHVRSVVALSEADEIVNSPKVKDHLDSLPKTDDKSLKVCFWEGVGHASCIAAPAKWRELKEAMLKQELEILQEAKE